MWTLIYLPTCLYWELIDAATLPCVEDEAMRKKIVFNSLGGVN